jgi:hypothetical protein
LKDRVTLRRWRPGTNFAVADVSPSIVKSQAGSFASQAPAQPANANPAAGVARSVTSLVSPNGALHVPGQEIPAGSLVTDP